MQFNEYATKIGNALQQKYHVSKESVDNNLEYFFESYINNVSPINCIKKFLSNTLQEAKQIDKFTIYKNQVFKLLEKCGIKQPQKYSKYIIETIKDYYESDVNTYDCSTTCLNEIKNNKIDIKHSTNPNIFATDIKNKLLYLLHNSDIDNFYLINTKVTPNSVILICNIKLFENIKNVGTSINGYCKELDKQLQPFVKLYVDAGSKINIMGYQLDENDLYCRVGITIDILKSDGFDDKKLNIKEVARIVKFYISVFDTFTSQNSQLYNADEKTGY